MKLRYKEPVSKCYFTLKTIPADDFRQTSLSYELSMQPPAVYSESTDSFGNRQIYGCEDLQHNEFVYKIRGVVETRDGTVCCGVNESRAGMYKYPYGKCIPGESINAFVSELKKMISDDADSVEKCRMIMHELHKRMKYVSGSTGIETTAEEAFSLGRGVCQDYAHIFICLLRAFAVPARYVCGFVLGEGQSHAWAEAACDGNYIAFDPTYDRMVNDEYIKIGVGRDAADCALNRGIMWGGGLQTQEISVAVKKYY